MKILIAEDDELIRRGLAEILGQEGYQTCEAADGRAALALFAAERPDFVLLDIMMPEVDGFEVCRRVVQTRPEVPVVFISAKTEEIDRVLGLELGADDFIMKPFGAREVIARIRAVTRRTLRAREARVPGTEARFQLSDLTVDPAELRARRGDRVIDLSLRDVRILQLLHRERGRAVSRQLLFDVCWGLNYLPNSRTIDQHVSQLRKRVEADPRNPRIIRTVHGVGYRYDDEPAP